jgi:hypothetical protein
MQWEYLYATFHPYPNGTFRIAEGGETLGDEESSARLRQLGAEGWDLVASSPFVVATPGVPSSAEALVGLWFRRPKQETEPEELPAISVSLERADSPDVMEVVEGVGK